MLRSVALVQRFPTWGTFAYLKGCIYCTAATNFLLRHKNGVYLYSFKSLQILLKIQQIFVILLSLVVIRNFRASCSSVKMVKGYMFRERLGTSAPVEIEPSLGSSWSQH